MRQIILDRIRSFEIDEIDLNDATDGEADSYAVLELLPDANLLRAYENIVGIVG